MQWGMGAYGGMQPCVGISHAGGASSEDDETAELKQDRADLRREKRDLEKISRQQERDFDGLRDNITKVIRSEWATVILDHMDGKKNCRTCAPSAPPRSAELPPPPATSEAPTGSAGSGLRFPRDRSESTTVDVPLLPQPRIVPSAPVVSPAPVPAPPTEEVPPVRVQRPSAPRPDAIPPVKGPSRGGASVARAQSRMPANETVSAGTNVRPASGSTSGSTVDAFLEGFTAGGDAGYAQTDGSPLLCNSGEPPYQYKEWRNICRDGGKIASQACTVRGYQVGGVKPNEASLCGRSLDRYARMVREMDKTRERLAQIDDEIYKIGTQLNDIKVAERANRDMEADCPSGRCYDRGSTRERQARAPSIGQTLLSLAPALIGGYVGYKTATVLGREANAANRETGNQAYPLAPHVASSTMLGIASGLSYPFAAGGFYGGAYGGVNGGMGCAPGVGQMSMGPGGFMTPPGIYGNMGGAFGYPPGFSQGGYPIMGGGMYNPGGGGWGANGPWGTGQWPGGYPGYGLAGQLAGGFAGQFAGGFAGGGGFAGVAGYPGAAGGFAGQFAGGFAGGGGFAGVAGYPGAAGGFAGQFAGGFAGGGGFAGVAGGYAGGPYAGLPFPGVAGGFAGQIAGGFAGIPYPGMPFPGGAGGFAGALAGGFAGGFGAQDPQLIQRQIEAQRSFLTKQQSFISEYSQFMRKWETYFGTGGFGPGGVPGGDYNYQAPTGLAGSGPTTGTPTGRTR